MARRRSAAAAGAAPEEAIPGPEVAAPAAAAPSVSSSSSTNLSNDSETLSAAATPETAPDTPVAPRPRRRNRSTADETNETADAAAQDAAPGTTRKRRGKATAAPAADAAQAVDAQEPALPVAAEAAAPPASENDASAPAAAGAEDAAPAKPARRRSSGAGTSSRRKATADAAATEPSAVASPVADTVPEATPDTRDVAADVALAPVQGDAVAEDAPSGAPAAAPEETPRRGGRRRGAKATAEPAPAAQEATPAAPEQGAEAAESIPAGSDVALAPVGDSAAPLTAEASPAPAEVDVAEATASNTAEAAPAEPQEVAPGASRSRRRRNKAAVAPAAPVESALPVELRAESPAAIDLVDPPADTPGTVASATGAQTAAEPTKAGRQRTRGVRKSKTEPGTGAEPAATPAVPAYQALPAETLARLPDARIVVRKNVPELVVNGEARLPFWVFVNTDDPDGRDLAARQIKGAYAAGIRFFTFLAHLPWRSKTGERRTGPLDDVLDFVAANAPEAFLLPRLIFSPPVSWERTHEPEMTLYPDGEAGDVSLGSRAFWEDEAEPALRAAVEHVAQSQHAGRVFGFYLEHGEWFHDYRRGYDVSEPNVQAFRAWLRGCYQNDVIALRAAWHDGAVTFENAAVPPAIPAGGSAQTSGGGPLNVLYSEREGRYRDFHAFSSDVVAQVITRLGRAVKEASGNRSLVAASYGYALELPRAGSGHLGLATLLNSPFVDVLTGPYSYASRLPGGSAALPAPVASVALAGKLWVSEDDTKTFLARGETPDEEYNPRVANAGDTLSVHVRNAGAALTQAAGLSWMDLWGQGWLDDAQVWDNVNRLRDVAEKLATRRRNPRTRPFAPPDVAVIVDERSFFGIKADERLLGQLIAGQRDALLRSGARVGFYLLSDLLRKNFPDTPRLLLFLNAFRLPADVREAIKERFQNDGRTLAWLFGPGCLETGDGGEGLLATGGDLADVIGMQIRLQPWGSKTGTLITDSRSPLTDNKRGQRVGDDVRINPSYAVSDPKATVLGEYAASGNASLAVRKHATWQSVFFGETHFSPDLLRGLYRLAGVPVYSDEDDVCYVGDSLVCLHSTAGGPVTVALPEEAILFDVVRGETLARDGRGQRLLLKPRETRLLFYGTPAEVVRLGGDPNAGPAGLTAAELPPPAPPFVFEPGARTKTPARTGTASAPAPPDVSPEDEALMAQAFADPDAFMNKETDSDAENDFVDAPDDGVGDPVTGTTPAATVAATGAAGKKRRRRRRGGGRREPGEEGSEASMSAANLPGDDETDGSAASSTDDLLDALDLNPADLPAATATSANNAPDAPTSASGRPLPPLSELLPDSEAPRDGGDLPPVPEELLPLGADEALLVVTGATPEEAAEMTGGLPATDNEAGDNGAENDPADAPAASARRRRGGRSRTRRAAATNDGGGDAAPETPGDEGAFAPEASAEGVPGITSDGGAGGSDTSGPSGGPPAAL